MNENDGVQMYSTIELFAGAGGLALGIEKAGFKPLALIELNKDACDTLKKNRPGWNVICDDIANISKLDLKEYFDIPEGGLDFLSGGAPCQSFRMQGKGWDWEIRVVRCFITMLFFAKTTAQSISFENVRGLLSHDHGRTYKTILNVFTHTGYTIQKSVLNAWDYGVPQKRERLIMVGIRNDLVDKVKFSFPKPHEYKPVLRDILSNVPPSAGVPYGDSKKNFLNLFRRVDIGGI